MQVVLYNYLSKYFQVTLVTNSIEAMACLYQSSPVDGIVADLDTSSDDGFIFINQLNASTLYSTIPAIVLVSQFTDLRKMQYGIPEDRLVFKPFNPHRLSILLRSLTSQERQEKC